MLIDGCRFNHLVSSDYKYVCISLSDTLVITWISVLSSCKSSLTRAQLQSLRLKERACVDAPC